MTRRDVLRHGALAPAAFLPQAARLRGGPDGSRRGVQRVCRKGRFTTAVVYFG